MMTSFLKSSEGYLECPQPTQEIQVPLPPPNPPHPSLNLSPGYSQLPLPLHQPLPHASSSSSSSSFSPSPPPPPPSSSSSSSSLCQNPYFFPRPQRWNVNQNGENILSNLYNNFFQVIRPSMSNLRKTQRQIPLFSKDIPTFEGLKKMQDHARGTIMGCLQECQNLLHSSILTPGTIKEACFLERDLKLELKQLEIYEKEWELLRTGSLESVHQARLMIVKQPFPKAIMKGATVSGADGEEEEPTLVRLMTGSKVKLCDVGEVVVRAEMEFMDGKRGVEKEVVAEKVLDGEGYASFYDLKIGKSTRVNIAHLRFYVSVRFLSIDGVMEENATTLVSDLSEPFVVIANESQWDKGEGMLFRKQAFSKTSISWEYMANLLQIHFLRATRQDITHPKHPLSLYTLNYLSKLLFKNHPIITKEAFEGFWEWFKLACRRIRFQKHFHSLWMEGLILGFISREETEKLLSFEKVGTFIIRFSETNPGSIVLSYVKVEGKIGHYLLAYGPKNEQKQKNLCDVLQTKTFWAQKMDNPKKHLRSVLFEQDKFRTVLKINTKFTVDNKCPLFTRQPKIGTFFQNDLEKGKAPPLSSDYDVDSYSFAM